MPFPINAPGTPFLPLRDYTQAEAATILTGLAGHVRSKSGVLKLTRPDDPNQSAIFERKSWYQFHERKDSNMEETSDFLRHLFTKALQDCPEEIRVTFLANLNRYLRVLDNQFETKALVKFVERLTTCLAHPVAPAVERPGSLTPPAAMKLLTELRDQVDGQKGKLTLGPGSKRGTFTIQARRWYRFLDRFDGDMNMAAASLRKTFEASLGDCDKVATAKFLSEIDDYLFSRGDKFGAESFVKFVGKLESLKSSSEAEVKPSSSEIEAKPSNLGSRPPQEREAIERFIEKTNNFTPTDAMEYLTGLRSDLEAENGFLKGGFLTLEHNLQQQSITIKRVGLNDIGSGAKRIEVIEFLKRVCERALGDRPESERKEFLLQLDRHFERRENTIGANFFVEFVTELEEILMSSPEPKPGSAGLSTYERDSKNLAQERFVDNCKRLTTSSAMKWLTTLRSALKEKSGGVLALEFDRKRHEIVFTSMTPSQNRRDQDIKRATGALARIFWKALGGKAPQDCTPGEGEFLTKLEDDLKTGHNQFDAQKFVAHVDELEKIKSNASLQIQQPEAVAKFFKEVDNLTPTEAMKYLAGLRSEIKTGGFMTLAHDPQQGGIVIEGTDYDYNQADDDLKRASEYLLRVFEKALVGCDERRKVRLLSRLASQITGRYTKFDAQKFVAYVDELEEIKEKTSLQNRYSEDFTKFLQEVDELTPAGAMTYLNSLKAQVNEKNYLGNMTLAYDTGRKSIGIKSEEQGYGYNDEDLKQTSEMLLRVFYKALEECTPGQKDWVRLYFDNHEALKDKFHTPSLWTLVDRLEGFKSSREKAALAKSGGGPADSDLEALKNGVPPGPPTGPEEPPGNGAKWPDLSGLGVPPDRLRKFEREIRDLEPKYVMTRLLRVRDQIAKASGSDVMMLDLSPSWSLLMVPNKEPSTSSLEPVVDGATKVLKHFLWKALGGRDFKDCTHNEREFLAKLDGDLEKCNNRFSVEMLTRYIEEAWEIKNTTGLEDRHPEAVDKFYNDVEKLTSTPADAMTYLVDLRNKVARQSGNIMTFVHDPERESLVIKAEVEGDDLSAKDLNETAKLLHSVFLKALEECDEDEKHDVYEGPYGDMIRNAGRGGYSSYGFVSIVNKLESFKKAREKTAAGTTTLQLSPQDSPEDRARAIQEFLDRSSNS